MLSRALLLSATLLTAALAVPTDVGVAADEQASRSLAPTMAELLQEAQLNGTVTQVGFASGRNSNMKGLSSWGGNIVDGLVNAFNCMFNSCRGTWIGGKYYGNGGVQGKSEWENRRDREAVKRMEAALCTEDYFNNLEFRNNVRWKEVCREYIPNFEAAAAAYARCPDAAGKQHCLNLKNGHGWCTGGPHRFAHLVTWMRNSCKNACGYCGTERTPAAHPSRAQVQVELGCYDADKLWTTWTSGISTNCERFKKSGWCTWESAKKKCEKTCGVCQ